ncbi:galactoside 2-alpha-L-fucosyltransferase SEC1-like [Atheta coriaria]|uniref:galactoside 2-alpha-L-fucosyltransferase SEC1-like n=1 Tax=Dalotia coriaria TaxID=877792 RepID=UPI0031F44E07
MINPHQNLLFVATILALCVISFVHVFLFPLYDADAKRFATKTYFDFEQSLCMANLRHRRPWQTTTQGSTNCPRGAIVTIVQGGRLGNQMWEYASVWAVARRTGLEAYIPRCIQVKLEQIFESLSIPSFEDIAHCPLDLGRFVRSLEAWNYNNQSVVLPRYSIQPDVVLTWVHDIVSEFTFRRKWRVKSQQVLRAAVEGIKSKGNAFSFVFVGVHIRRTDYIGYLWRKHGVPPAEPQFYITAMNYYKKKFHGREVLFVVISDDPRWCQRKFGGMRNVYVPSRALPNTPALDLAILAACNHSIFDYGTFGIWGAILAGGETVYYNLSRHSSMRVGQLLPNWHAMS